jgi:hypothetical protein
MPMLQRLTMVGCLVASLAIPMTARSQEVPPVIFSGPLSHPRFDAELVEVRLTLGKGIVPHAEVPLWQTVDWRFAADPSLAGVVGELWLGATPFSELFATVDTQVSLLGSGPGLSLHWFPSEEMRCTLRFDPLRCRLSSGAVVTLWAR